jgi:hypothetical protein
MEGDAERVAARRRLRSAEVSGGGKRGGDRRTGEGDGTGPWRGDQERETDVWPVGAATTRGAGARRWRFWRRG